MSLYVPNTLRLMNKSLVLNLIREQTPITRAKIATMTGITKATISEIVAELLAEQIIFEDGMTDGGLGRKGVQISFNADHTIGLGIDLGGTKISLSLFNLNAELLATVKIDTFQTQSRDEFLILFIKAIEDFIQSNLKDRHKLKVIGIATPGIIDYHNGIVLEGSPNLPQWEQLPLAKIITTQFNIPVILENDIRASLIGEMFKGKCQQVKNAALIGIGTGLGSALLMDGKIIRGHNNAAGEIGYMLFNREQLYRNWGNKGFFESVCSGSGLSDRYYEITQTRLSTKQIFTESEQGNHIATTLIDDLVDYLTIGSLNLITVANPEMIILTGGVMQSSELFLQRIQDNIDRHTFKQTKTRIEVSQLDNVAPLYGIAILALHEIYPAFHFIPDTQIS